MGDRIVRRLTIIIEATNCESIPSKVMKSIKTLEDAISTESSVKLSFKNELNQTRYQGTLGANRTDNLSPKNWDYWPV